MKTIICACVGLAIGVFGSVASAEPVPSWCAGDSHCHPNAEGGYTNDHSDPTSTYSEVPASGTPLIVLGSLIMGMSVVGGSASAYEMSSGSYGGGGCGSQSSGCEVGLMVSVSTFALGTVALVVGLYQHDLYKSWKLTHHLSGLELSPKGVGYHLSF